MKAASLPSGWIARLFVGLLLVIFGGIVLHAPISVGFGVLFPAADLLIKSWKEILMAVAAVLGLVLLWRQGRLGLVKQPLLLLIAGYALLHLLLIPVFYSNVTAVLAGLLINLRFLLFFVLVYLAVVLYPGLRRQFLWVFAGGALVVGLFALAQVLILPPDFLAIIGYSTQTIVPFLTVDQNPDFVRITSTLRGPNPLGAYAVIVLAVVAAFYLRRRRLGDVRRDVVAAVASVGSLVALWFSYSRSALIAFFAAMGVIFTLTRPIVILGA